MNNMNMNNMNMQNMNNMNMNGMNGMNNMNGMGTMNAMNMKMNAAGQYPMSNMAQQQQQQQQPPQQQHFTGMPGQQQPQPQQGVQGQGQQPPQQQIQPQFMMQGVNPQFQRVPQGMRQQGQPPQPHQQQQLPGQPQQTQGPPPPPTSSQFPDAQYSSQMAPSMIMTSHQGKSTGPSSAVLPPQQQPQPLSATNAGTSAGHTPVPTGAHTPGSSGVQPQQQRGAILAGGNANGRSMMRPGVPTNTAVTGVNGMNMGMSANANAVMNYRRHVTNTETLKFLDFCELVGVRSESTKNILYWKKIITEYFSESGVLRYSVKAGGDSRQFEFSVPIIPRFFFSIIQSGVTRIEIQPGMLRTQVLPNGTTYLESPRCCFTHHYADGSYVNIHGSMKGILNQALRIDWLDFQTHVFIPGVEWPSLEKLLSDETKMKDVLGMLNESESPSSKPNGSGSKDDKSSDPKRLKVLQKFRSNFEVFHSMSNFGLQESVMRVMQVSDVMAHLRSLMMFSITSNSTGPLQSLDEFVARSLKKDGTPAKTTATTATTAATTQNNSTQNSAQKKSEPASQRNSPIPEGSPQLRSAKMANLDLSQSTLSKRRRKSTAGELSPKSLAESPKAKPKKSKR